MQNFASGIFLFSYTCTHISIKTSWEKKIWNYTNWINKRELFKFYLCSNFVFISHEGLQMFLFIDWLSSGDLICYLLFFCNILPYHVIFNKQGFLFNLYVHVFTCHVSEECCQHMHKEDLGFDDARICIKCLFSPPPLFFWGGGFITKSFKK